MNAYHHLWLMRTQWRWLELLTVTLTVVVLGDGLILFTTR